MYSARACQIII